ncbi:hypothetical protein COEREDRAFT_79691 [Coemansia reversa NRRL 1564]|uniref:Uncharacterized protein n=1 Tax=Coemansia reversa (strain ATCC 12441 / NRRL 1564) TaxID=763665 RepID=A0A2G5BI45_COERN|nr:hypothetical protein COEREDRAFT_79691 [Coemansia reversa NRRL 1564]|eukprot:PIA18689.1 hypothetical protein COEREDRAFT_79691 [Coemansia reversa NRRL 1564]
MSSQQPYQQQHDCPSEWSLSHMTLVDEDVIARITTVRNGDNSITPIIRAQRSSSVWNDGWSCNTIIDHVDRTWQLDHSTITDDSRRVKERARRLGRKARRRIAFVLLMAQSGWLHFLDSLSQRETHNQYNARLLFI